jgi:hypothetical protein
MGEFSLPPTATDTLPDCAGLCPHAIVRGRLRGAMGGAPAEGHGSVVVVLEDEQCVCVLSISF